MTVLVNLKKIFVTCQIQIFIKFEKMSNFWSKMTNLGVENFITSFYEMQKLALSWLAKSNGQLLNPNETRTNLFISQNMKKHEKMTKINKN